jgi:hypothetical protein
MRPLVISLIVLFLTSCASNKSLDSRIIGDFGDQSPLPAIVDGFGPPFVVA